jgi:alpha-beta hydrolase superfamily lysophospholipase
MGRPVRGRHRQEQLGRAGALLIRTLLLSIAAFAFLYFAVAACLLRFALEPLVLPRVPISAHTNAPLILRISDDEGNALLVQRHGTPKIGCVVFFPGQHGLISEYERNFFPAFSDQGIAVLAVAYPGQNGAPGAPHFSEILALAEQVATSAQAMCPGHRVVLYGRSFGSMVAAYAAGRSRPAGLILESAAPSFSSAVRLRLSSRWYLAPLALLPASKLLAHDYSLTEALRSMLDVPTVVFQGTADNETPLAVLRAADLPSNLQLVVVSGGSHSTTYMLARDQIIKTTLSMLRAQKA